MLFFLFYIFKDDRRRIRKVWKRIYLWALGGIFPVFLIDFGCLLQMSYRKSENKVENYNILSIKYFELECKSIYHMLSSKFL